jgi:hypothetical protein
MQIDPVVVLVDRIRQAEAELQAQCNANSQRYSLKRAEAINLLLQCVRDMYEALVDTAPTSALGAGELIRVAARRLPFSHARYAAHLERIADRLGAGQRLHCDLVWLRALADALTAGMPDERNDKTAALLTLAIRGAAQPVLVWRRTVSRRPAVPDLTQLSDGPFHWLGRNHGLETDGTGSTA